MKNKAGFYIKSLNCQNCENLGMEKISFRCTEGHARQTGVEWHHGGAGIIAFFPKDEKEEKIVKKLKDDLKNRQIKSKKAAWEFLEKNNCENGKYKIEAKIGKYGYFIPSFGEPDVIFKINDWEIYCEIYTILKK